MPYQKRQRKVSVIMGIYNCASTLAEAIDSLLAQTFTDWELIMCDDGSTDDTVAIAKSYVRRFDNILLIHNEHNMGLPATLNHCLEFAESEYIARMDGDDISMPERFEKEVNFLDSNPDYALVSCSMICFDEKGDWGVQGHKEKPQKKDFAYESPFCHAPCMMRRKVLNEIGNYTVREQLKRGQDYFLWHKFYCAGYKGYNLQEPLYKMRDDQDAANRRGTNLPLIKRVKGRYGRAILQMEIMHDLGLPRYYDLLALRPILVAMLPNSLYNMFHRLKIRHN